MNVWPKQKPIFEQLYRSSIERATAIFKHIFLPLNENHSAKCSLRLVRHRPQLGHGANFLKLLGICSQATLCLGRISSRPLSTQTTNYSNSLEWSIPTRWWWWWWYDVNLALLPHTAMQLAKIANAAMSPLRWSGYSCEYYMIYWLPAYRPTPTENETSMFAIENHQYAIWPAKVSI